MPPTNVKGPKAPRRPARRPSAGPAGPYPVIGPPRPTHHHPASLGPAGAGPFTIGPRKPLQTVQQASPAQRRRLVAQYTHRGPSRTALTLPTNYGPQMQRRAARIGRAFGIKDFHPGGITLTKSHGPSSASALDKAIRSVATPVLRDYVEIPANIVPATYHLATTAGSGHVRQAAHMLAQPYVDLYHDPIGSFKAHPLGSALLFAGPRSVVGRGGGALARLAPAESAVGRLGALERAPRTVAGTTLAETRKYSPDLMIKAGQVGKERAQAAHVRRVQAKAARELRAGRHEHADELILQAKSLNPARMSEHEVRRRVDERLDANEIIRRQHRAQVLNAVDRSLPKKGKEAVPLVAQNITRPHAADLAAYRAEISTNNLSRPSRVKANRDLQAQIRSAETAPDMAAVQRAADTYRDLTHPLREKLVDYGLLDKEAADMSPLVPYAVRHMGGRFSKEHKTLLDAEGNALTPDAIRAHMTAHGFKEPAYVTQAPRRSGKGNYYVPQHEAPKLARQQRTGEATRKGTFNAHPDVLREGAARMQGLVDAHEGYSRFVGEFAHRGPSRNLSTFNSHSDAADAADDLAASTGVRWRPVKLKPFSGTNRQVASVLEHTHDEHAPQTTEIVKALENAITDDKGPGPYALVPDAAADQLYQHMRVQGAGSSGKAFQVAQGAFRKTVLATNVRWLFGNTAEAALRSAIGRAGPRSYLTAQRTLAKLDEIDPKAAEELRARALGGGHFTMADRMPKRTAEQFQGTRLEPLAKGLARFWRAPGPRQVVGLWHGWTDFVFHRVNQPLEAQFQKAMLGAEIRRTVMPREVVKLSTRAVDQAAHGLRGTAEQVRLAREVDRMYGTYSKFSPSQRRVMVLYTPFVAWTLNAVKFVSSVLPKDHPMLTSLLVSASQVTEEWRKSHGLSKFMQGAAPSFLQGSVPISGDRKIRASRYTPFGAYGSLPETFADSVLPQFSGVLSALKGEDWKGKPLRDPSGQPVDDIGRGAAAARAFAEATIPLLGQAERAGTAGGSVAQRARVLTDPLIPVAPNAKAGSKAGAIDWGAGPASGGKVDWGRKKSPGKIAW